MRRCGAHLTCNVPASFLGDVADRLGQGYHVIATCNDRGLLLGPQQSLSVAHLMGLDETAGNLTSDRGLPRLGLLAPRASWLADTAAGHPRLSGNCFPRCLLEALTDCLFQDPHRATTHICSRRQLVDPVAWRL